MAEHLPLSLSQQEVWLDQRAWPESTHLNIGGAGYIDGPFSLDLFRQAMQLMVAENEALRLVPGLEGGQVLLDRHDATLKLVDVSQAEHPLEAMRAWWQAWMAEPFAFDGTPPWRFALLRHSDSLHGLAIQFHHLIMDGWGTAQVMQRWATIYNALASAEPVPPRQGPSYRQFIEESLDYRNSPVFEKDGEFWQEQLPELPLPLFDRRYPVDVLDGLPHAHVVTRRIPRPVYDEAGKVAGELGATTFTYLIAVIASYLSQAHGRQEVVIGLPSLNRASKRYRETFGMFVGVFPLVVKAEPGMTVRDLVTSVNLALKGAVRHQRYPLSELARYLAAIRQGRDSIFDVLFSFERQDYDLNFGAGRSFGARQVFSGLSRYPLGITLGEFQAKEDAELTLEASPACFSGVEAEQLGQRLVWLMQEMMADPGKRLDALPLLTPEERSVLVGCRATEPSPAPYVCQFEAQARQSPDAPAVVWDGGAIDYATLNAWADRLAQRLRLVGAGPNRVVALMFERSVEMVAAMLAVSKAGAAFLPLDPDAPPERLRGMLADSDALAVLLQTKYRERFAALHANTVLVGETPESGLTEAPPATPAEPGDLAYILFTSGSTGRPKGVMVEHEALSRRLAWISRTYQVQAADRAGQCTQATFDPSLIELCLPLTNGASIALPPPGRLSPSTLGSFAVRHGVTIMALVPSTLRGLLDSIRDRRALKLRVACCGGETLPAELANRFIDETDARLFNVYGPTEATIFATAWACVRQALDTALPLGRPIDGSRIYILDSFRRLLPVGVVGEIYIAGPCVARGYVNRPDLDAGAFGDDPFVSGDRMYRSGDRGWLAADGTLHFVGRIDRQVKLRGYRIELGEIESSLLEIGKVRQAAVKVVEADGKQVIHAWVAVPDAIQAEDLRRHLATRLPDYMLPSGFSCLPELPLNATGKIAYDLLPEPEANALPKRYRAPGSDLERALLAIWKLALKRDDLGVSDNFFDVGGDSLAAVDILSGMDTLLGRRVPLFMLIENPSVERLAGLFDGKAEQLGGDGVLLRLGRGERGMPLYFAASGQGDLVRFKALAEKLGDACDFFMLQPPENSPALTIPELARMYADKILEHGRPGLIAGFSVGGIAALETARLLQSQWKDIPLCMVDVVFPGRVVRSAVFWRFLGWLARHLNANELSMNGRNLGGLFSDPGLIAQINAMSQFRVEPYEGPVRHIKSAGLLRWERWIFKSWNKFLQADAPDIVVPGLHGSIFEKVGIDTLADRLKSILDTRGP